ncbi:MAG: hypothetical protein CNF00_00135 [Candidatus Thioglobus sp. MED-G25]|nr:MAG: hypothetical protein CNF00_00135 [Candidatus Thioglobus sp. MED-G25]
MTKDRLTITLRVFQVNDKRPLLLLPCLLAGAKALPSINYTIVAVVRTGSMIPTPFNLIYRRPAFD